MSVNAAHDRVLGRVDQLSHSEGMAIHVMGIAIHVVGMAIHVVGIAIHVVGIAIHVVGMAIHVTYSPSFHKKAVWSPLA